MDCKHHPMINLITACVIQHLEKTQDIVFEIGRDMKMKLIFKKP